MIKASYPGMNSIRTLDLGHGKSWHKNYDIWLFIYVIPLTMVLLTRFWNNSTDEELHPTKHCILLCMHDISSVKWNDRGCSIYDGMFCSIVAYPAVYAVKPRQVINVYNSLGTKCDSTRHACRLKSNMITNTIIWIKKKWLRIKCNDNLMMV